MLLSLFYWPQLALGLIITFSQSVVFHSGKSSPHHLKHRINLLCDSVLLAKGSYRMSPGELVEVRKQLDKYLSKGWIRPNTSLYGSPYFFARKKDGTLRMYIDHRL